MKKVFIDDSLAMPPNYAHAVLVNNTEVLFSAGGVPIDKEGNVVGENDINRQIQVVINNLLSVLRANSYELSDIVKSIIYVVSDDSNELSKVWDQLAKLGFANAKTASTLVGVNSLGYKGQLVEIEIIASK